MSKEITYFNAYSEQPNRIWNQEYDAIVLDPTFLAYRWARPHEFRHIRKTFAFLKYARGLKIALPQDDYDCHLTLDDWMVDWNFHIIYTVCPQHWDILYPKFSKSGRIMLAFTGYIPDNLLTRKPKAFSEREIDIGYRAKRLPPWFGRIGQNKSRIGELVEEEAKGLGLTTDIIVGDSGTIFGGAWYDFLENCKFTLGANSGSSLLDPYGDIQRNIKKYLDEHDNQLDFETAESLFFPGLDGLYSFTALSPRNIEAALCNSCQILVKGDYSNILKPWEDYLPLEADASNLKDLMPIVRDEVRIARIVQSCRERILNTKDLYYSSKANKIVAEIEQFKQRGLKEAQSKLQSCKKSLTILEAKTWIGSKHLRAKAHSWPAIRLIRKLVGHLRAYFA